MPTEYHPPFYDGTIYSLVFDPLLSGLHRRIARWVGSGGACLDACCGTGALTRLLAESFQDVHGIDLSPQMISRAERLRRRRKTANITFRVGDVSRLPFEDRCFEVAVSSMGLHEMPQPVRARVLPELLRVAGRVVLVDFTAPMPRNLAGYRNRLIELLAGPRHFRGFRDFQRRGGLPALVREVGANITRRDRTDQGTTLMLEIVA